MDGWDSPSMVRCRHDHVIAINAGWYGGEWVPWRGDNSTWWQLKTRLTWGTTNGEQIHTYIDTCLVTVPMGTTIFQLWGHHNAHHCCCVCYCCYVKHLQHPVVFSTVATFSLSLSLSLCAFLGPSPNSHIACMSPALHSINGFISSHSTMVNPNSTIKCKLQFFIWLCYGALWKEEEDKKKFDERGWEKREWMRFESLNCRAISWTGKLCPNVLTNQRRHLLPSTLYIKIRACQARGGIQRSIFLISTTSNQTQKLYVLKDT